MKQHEAFIGAFAYIIDTYNLSVVLRKGSSQLARLVRVMQLVKSSGEIA